MAVTFDEMKTDSGGSRPAYAGLADWLKWTPSDHFDAKRKEAEILFRRTGITFAVYGEGGDPERLIPFDIVPRVLTATEWEFVDRGLRQRASALNAFLQDIYGPQDIVKAGIVPAALIHGNDAYLAGMHGLQVPGGVYNHISGIDLVRVSSDEFYVLEDNVRTPSGVSYMLENREVMMRLFPDLFSRYQIAPVDSYPDALLETLCDVAPPNCPGEPTVALLTPGRFNSAYYEHSFLADKMGIELVEGQDLFVRDDHVYMRTTQGPMRVDVIYRRIDDDFLDPLMFNPDSVLGVPGIMHVYRAGNVTVANAVGVGVADDKAVYTYVPDMIRFYLGEEAVLNNVPTWRCGEADDLAYVLEHLPELVVKEVHGSGGYGMLIGPSASKSELEKFRAVVSAKPDAYIAQPTLALSTCPTFVDSGVAPRHVDLRPFVLQGKDIRIVKGGLTRVALPQGSLVVNSSQGGGTKDTWIIEETGVG